MDLRAGEAGTEAGVREDAALPREAYALLAQANLHRMRGQWDAAAEKCMAALRLAPDSASANSLLGDIYENQGRYDDAAQWYRMALDANPDSPADRLKLDRLRRNEDALHNQSPALRPAPPKSPAKPAVPGLLHRLKRDPELILRLGAAFAALGLVLVVFCAYRIVHPGAMRALGLGGDSVVSSKPVVVPPVAGTLPADPDGVEAHDPSEAALLTALQGAQDLSRQGIAVYDVQVDPRVRRMTVTFGVPQSPGMTQGQVSEYALRVLQDAAAGQAADTFTARCFLVPASGSPLLAFVGDASHEGLQAPGPASTGTQAADTQVTDTQALAAFTNTWWSATADIRP